MVIRCRSNRDRIFNELRQRQIVTNVHYRPVYQHSFYRERFDVDSIHCPTAEAAYQEILSLPIFPTMEDHQVEFVSQSLAEVALATAVSA
jgi:perosamine synthetase